jgi:murein DD-endopeptidase MepM/ murein hydrolase activator NlpD
MKRTAALLALAAGVATVQGLDAQQRREIQREPETGETVQRLSGAARRLASAVGPAPPLDRIEPSAAQREALDRRPGGRITTGALGTRRRAMADVSPPLDDFPYQAQDLAANERVLRGKAVHNPDDPTSTWQQFAYDLGVSRQQPDGSWRDTESTVDWSDPKNSDYYIYGKPVYAVSDGVVVNCWRNAPENPRPYSGELDDSYDGIPLAEQTWLHEDTRAGKVHGSGNFIMVREDNGNHVHYAHGRPGTIPQRLCPHNGVYLSPASWDADSSVPEPQQARIRRGDLLFETGNAGTSSAPHLHLDRTAADKATSVRLLFRHGLANPLDKATWKLATAEWASFAGEQIPPGPVLVWPPRRAGGLWSWHGMDAATWGQHFKHMADSGYQMTWIDGYSVSGTPFFNTIWRPATAPWLGYALLTGADYQSTFEQATADGFALVHVDSVLAGSRPRYNAIFVQGAPMGFVARHGQSNADFNATFQDLTGKGYVAVNASVVPVDGQLRYTTLYRKLDLGGWVLLPGIPKRDYQRVYDENAALGRHPYYVNAFKHGRDVFYSVVFSEKPAGPRKDRHGLSPGAYESEFGSAGNLAIRAVSGVDAAASNHEYIAVWRRND